MPYDREIQALERVIELFTALAESYAQLVATGSLTPNILDALRAVSCDLLLAISEARDHFWLFYSITSDSQLIPYTDPEAIDRLYQKCHSLALRPFRFFPSGHRRGSS